MEKPEYLNIQLDAVMTEVEELRQAFDALTLIANRQAETIRLLTIAIENARAALKEINKYNRISNDLDAYLDQVAEFGMGILIKLPKPESYGL